VNAAVSINMAPIAGVAIALAVLCLFVGFYRLAKPAGELEDRLAEAGGIEPALRMPAEDRLRGAVGRITLDERLARDTALALARADISLTVNEYVLIRVGAALGGAILGALALHNLVFGIAVGLLGLQVPVFILHRRMRQRQLKFQGQLVDVLSMLVSGLKAGVGLVQAMDLVQQEMPSPAREEFGRVVRETSLGATMGDALANLKARMPSDDLALVITVINVQAEVGGNLATVLEGIVVTIRERVRIAQEIRTITAQQRITGYVLAALPFFVGGFVSFIRPDYMMPLFSAQWIWMPATALVMVIAGFFVINRIVDIKV
jgi:tight adherence protein B